MLATVLGGAGAVIAALLGAGVWALMVQALSSELVGVVFAWGTCRWRPRMRFSWRRLRPLLTFGWGLVLTRLLWSVLGRVPDFFIGRTIGTEAVGIYRVAWRLVDLLGQMFLAPLSNITFLTLARLQNDRARFEAVYARVVGLGALTMAPLVVGFGVTAQDVVPLVFGPRSSGSIPIAQILAISAPAFVINYFTTSALLAKGKSYVVSQAAAVQLVSTLAVSALVAPYGVIALTIAYVARGYLTLPYIQYLVHRHAQVGLVAVFRFVRAPVIAVTTMAAALVAIRPFVEGISTSAVLRLAIFVPTGAIIYVAMLVVIDRGLLQSHFLFARSLFNRPPGGPQVGDDDSAQPSNGT
jgi:O-antigen/teichoic acid export membrane protein